MIDIMHTQFRRSEVRKQKCLEGYGEEWSDRMTGTELCYLFNVSICLECVF